MVQPERRGGQHKFLDALADDPFVSTGAYALLMGVDPYNFVDLTDGDDFLIKTAMLRKAMEFKAQENEQLAAMIGVNVAKLLGFIR